MTPQKTTDDRIRSLVESLASNAGSEREDARHQLIKIGRPAVPLLISAMTHDNAQARWEAAKALNEIHDPAAAPAFVRALHDENSGVRWIAAEGLIGLGKYGLDPLLHGLMRHSDSKQLRDGAHHVLAAIKRERLSDIVQPVIDALESSEPISAAPVAAYQALQELGTNE